MPPQSETRSQALSGRLRQPCRLAGAHNRLVRPFRLSTWMIAMLLFAAACGGSSPGDVAVVAEDANEAVPEPAPTSTPQTAVAESAPTSTPQPVVDGPAPFPSTVVATSAGGQIDFGSLAGQDTVLWFWAPW